jgi:chromosome segregation ATPase
LDERLYKKCFKRWLYLSKMSNGNVEEKQEVYDLFLVDLKQYELYLWKIRHMLEVLEREKIHYQAEVETIIQDIEKRSKEILGLKEKLEYEKEQKEHRKKYDQVAKTILEYPSKEESEKDIEMMEQTIENLKKEQEKGLEKYGEQTKRIEYLFTVLDELNEFTKDNVQYNHEQKREEEEEEEEEGAINERTKVNLDDEFISSSTFF